MAEGAATATSSAGEDKGNALWNILPSFDPTTDNAKEYTDKVKFLRGICPVAQRAMLAPRLALLCKGTAWSQVKTIAPEKFTSPEDGVKNLLKALEVWQESEELQTYDQFEKAFYKVSQKGDESVVSFVNRLNVAFNEVGDETTVKQVKAFVLLRQSNLSPEDKRRVISMADGYDAHKVETAMRSLAAKVLGGNEGTESKIYPVNYVEDETEEIYYIHDEEMDDDQALAVLLEEGDESALVVSEFEDQIIQVCQDSPELSMAFSAYQEARAKLRDKARNRGFWPLRPSSKGKGKGKKGKIFGKRRQSLAERIASSNCRHCGARGHWKDECPARNKSSSTADANVMFYDEVQDDGAGELVCALPDGTYFAQWQGSTWKSDVQLKRNSKGLFIVKLSELLEAAETLVGNSLREEVITLTSTQNQGQEGHSTQALQQPSSFTLHAAENENDAAEAAQSKATTCSVLDPSRGAVAPRTRHVVIDAEADPGWHELHQVVCDSDGYSPDGSCRSRNGSGCGASGARGETSTWGQDSASVGHDQVSRGISSPRCITWTKKVCPVHDESHQAGVPLGTELPVLCNDGLQAREGDSTQERTAGEGDRSLCSPSGVRKPLTSRSRSCGLGSSVQDTVREGKPDEFYIGGQESPRSRRLRTDECASRGDQQGGEDHTFGHSSTRSRTAPDRPEECMRDRSEQSMESTSEMPDPTVSQSLQNAIEEAMASIEVDLARLKTIWKQSRESDKAPSWGLGLLEIYCSPDSEIIRQATKLGLKVKRFTRQDGDLSTPAGQAALWKILEEEKPRDVWMSPDCKHWGNFSRRNMGRSISSANKVLEGRQNEKEENENPEENPEENVGSREGDSGDGDDADSLLFGDDVVFNVETGDDLWEIDIPVDSKEESVLLCAAGPDESVLLVSDSKKRKVEVRLSSLRSNDQLRMAVAKHKEIGAWLKHSTVRKVAKGKIPDDAVTRCCWKAASPNDHPDDTKDGKKGKARLVVVGFEDPGVGVVQNDSPTLSKDGRQMVVQQVSSRGWDLISVDVSTAFLHGDGDGRLLGIHPPPELAESLGMTEGDQCELVEGAYGRVDAPFLWFCKFRNTLKKEGFRQCPQDPCVFTLVSEAKNGRINIHGSLGVHVDDGIGGGDEKFYAALERIREQFAFGSFEKGAFNFTGIRFRQWDDKSVEYDQIEYIEKISHIEVKKCRKAQVNSVLSPEEVTRFRSLIGALQYAAVHTRPDLAAKVGELQASVPRALLKVCFKQINFSMRPNKIQSL
eukprot:s2038_g10.t1